MGKFGHESVKLYGYSDQLKEIILKTYLEILDILIEFKMTSDFSPDIIKKYLTSINDLFGSQ